MSKQFSLIFKTPPLSALSQGGERFSTLVDPSMRDILLEHFNSVEELDESRTYDPQSTIFIANAFHLHPPEWQPKDYWYRKYISCGYPVILDNLFESVEFGTSNIDKTIADSIFLLNCKNWFWYYESIKWDVGIKLVRLNLLKFRADIWPQWKANGCVDKETQRRLDHNRDLFFNIDKIKSRMINEVISPILNYAYLKTSRMKR